MSGKIIIRPRRTKDSEPSSSRPTPSLSTPEPEPGPSEPELHEEEEEDTPLEEPENEIEAATEDDAQSEPGLVVSGTTPRPRGRPKGSANVKGKVTATSTPAGTPRPRGRPRGSGRGAKARGRGTKTAGGLVIRLPGKAGEDGSTPGPEGDAIDGVTEEVTAATEEAVEPEGPMGGGKPFRKIQNKVYIIQGDEFVSDEDPKGNTKIDPHGNLLGERRFKSQTFVLPNRDPDRRYMLAIDAARTSGFRDSLYYFRRNPLAFKLNATQPEKDYLIEIGKLGSHLRTRSVTLITARSAFKLHGSKMLIDGRWVVDDYFEDKMLEEITALGLRAGDLVGDLSDPQATNEAAQLAAGDKQGRGDRAGGGAGMYRSGGPTTIFGSAGLGPYSDGPLNAVRKSLLTRDGLNEENWMHIAAQRTMEASDEWAKLRKEALKVCGGILGDGAPSSPKRTADGELDPRDEKRRREEERDLPFGIYEPHSGIVLYRSDTQPTKSHWEVLDDHEKVLGGTKTGNGAWGLARVETIMEFPEEGSDHPNLG